MHFWIFSYNRGVFLQNCVSSLESLAPTCTISVFDDNSTDLETQKILAIIGQTPGVALGFILLGLRQKRNLNNLRGETKNPAS